MQRVVTAPAASGWIDELDLREEPLRVQLGTADEPTPTITRTETNVTCPTPMPAVTPTATNVTCPVLPDPPRI